MVRGRDAVLAMQDVLVEMSRRTGQAGAMDWLDYFMRSPDSLAKTPYLLLVGQGVGEGPDPARVDGVRGAVLVYEYRAAGRGTRVFATDDMLGIRTVIAPAESRTQVAEIAIRELIRCGAVMALVSLDGGVGEPEKGGGDPAYRTMRRTRWTPRYLELKRTLDETLSQLGKHTRRNLRYYRRRVEADFGAQFVPEVEISLEDFLELNRNSTNPAAEDVARWRYSLQRADARGLTMLAGLRAEDGRWLSLIGGRRYAQTTEIDWQLNVAGLPRYSLSTVMRNYVLEHEALRGTRRLAFEGGTPHPMRFAFTNAMTADILAVRRMSARAWLLKKFSRWIFPEKNFLAAALREMRPGIVHEPRPVHVDYEDAA